jgi:dTDP-4-dehydrorhamnose reductase
MSRAELDIANPASVEAALTTHAPWALINAAGFVRVDDAEHAQEQCWRENADGPATLAAACAQRNVALVTFSSDLVFDGNRDSPYVETDSVSPLNAYGRSKADAERRVLQVMPDALVIRSSSFFGPWDAHNIIARALDALANHTPFSVATDTIVSPTFVPDLVHATLDLLIDRVSGMWHIVNNGAVSWAELIRKAADLAAVDVDTLDDRPIQEFALPARRPRYSALSSTRAMLLPSLDDALERFMQQRESALEPQLV